MRTRKLGPSDLDVPVICLGTNVYGWTVPEADALRQLDAAVDLGLTFLDTADAYSRWVPGHAGGESESIIGTWIATRGRRADLVLATKVGSDMGAGHKGLSAGYITRAVEASLRRLQTDYIDLYQAHYDDPDTPIEESLLAFDALVKAGKVRHLGASNYSPARLATAMELSARDGLARFVSLQPHYNLMERGRFETELRAVVEQYGLGVIPYFSLAAGFLSGKYRRKEDAAGAPRGRTVEKYLNDRGFAVVAALDRVAQAQHATPAQVALAWLIAQPTVTSAIASATSDAQLRDLVAATQLTLSGDAIASLNAATAPSMAKA